MATGGEVTLYWVPGSVPSMSVMIALEEKGISYTKKEVDLDKLGKEAVKLNPREEVPIFTHNQLVLTESLAACMYLEESFGGTKLIPDDIEREALVLQRMYSAHNVGVGDVSICSYWGDDDPEEEEELDEDSDDDEDPEEKKDLKDLAEELAIWEEYLKEGEGSYIAGPDFTMADVAFFPVLAFIMWHGLQAKPNYPNLGKYYKMLKERPSVVACWYPEWEKPSLLRRFRLI